METVHCEDWPFKSGSLLSWPESIGGEAATCVAVMSRDSAPLPSVQTALVRLSAHSVGASCNKLSSSCPRTRSLSTTHPPTLALTHPASSNEKGCIWWENTPRFCAIDNCVEATVEVIACCRLLGVVVLWYMPVMFTRCGRFMVHAVDVVRWAWSFYGTCCC